MRKIRTCEVCGKTGYAGEVIYIKKRIYLCKKHSHQYWRFGETLDNNPLTIMDKNEIIICDNFAKLILLNNNQTIRHEVILDIESLEIVKDIKWSFSGIYAKCDKSRYGKRFMHEFILEKKNDKDVIDHINKNKLDNRKENLRICTNQQNLFNSKLAKNNTSGYTGVRWNGFSWVAYIKYNNKRINLGSFDNIEDAIRERLKFEKEYFNDFAPQKHLFEQYGIL